jgi:hypothetical protein
MGVVWGHSDFLSGGTFKVKNQVGVQQARQEISKTFSEKHPSSKHLKHPLTVLNRVCMFGYCNLPSIIDGDRGSLPELSDFLTEPPLDFSKVRNRVEVQSGQAGNLKNFF